MNQSSDTPYFEPHISVPKEVHVAKLAWYPYYYRFRLNNKREADIYNTGIAVFAEHGVDHRVYLQDGIAHVVMRLSLEETVADIKKRTDNLLDDE